MHTLTVYTGRPPAMKYVFLGDDDSDLVVHRRLPSGDAACGQRCRSPLRGENWAYDPRVGDYRAVGTVDVDEPITCLRPGCKG